MNARKFSAHDTKYIMKALRVQKWNQKFQKLLQKFSYNIDRSKFPIFNLPFISSPRKTNEKKDRKTYSVDDH